MFVSSIRYNQGKLYMHTYADTRSGFRTLGGAKESVTWHPLACGIKRWSTCPGGGPRMALPACPINTLASMLPLQRL